MTTVVIVPIVVVLGILAISGIEEYFSYKKRELETRLRLREMEAGYPPGTYSRLSKKDIKKAKKNGRIPEWDDADKEKERGRSEAEEREELINGIASLKERINNLETIMSHRKEGEKE